jgi:hypothetical protein
VRNDLGMRPIAPLLGANRFTKRFASTVAECARPRRGGTSLLRFLPGQVSELDRQTRAIAAAGWGVLAYSNMECS